MTEETYLSDALVFAAHPDDGELLAGGVMARMAAAGRRVILADGTRGEMGTRGTPEERAAEAAEGARILGIERINLGLPDGGISSDIDEAERAAVRAIREYRPWIVFTHTGGDHHPDHNGIHTAVRRAFFRANVAKYDTAQQRHAPVKLLYFLSGRSELPARVDFIADISEYWAKKVEAIKAHRSQFHGGKEGGPQTFLTSELFWTRLEARYAYFGSLVNVRYGEGFLVEGMLRLDDPMELPEVKTAL